MADSQRDRLVELFSPFADGTYNGSGTLIDGTKVDDVVDSLLANGVIVPPCRCKDCTYLRESDTTNRMFCTYHGDGYEFEVLPNHYCSNGVGMVKGV